MKPDATNLPLHGCIREWVLQGSGESPIDLTEETLTEVGIDGVVVGDRLAQVSFGGLPEE